MSSKNIRLLVIRLSAMGDVAMTVPMLREFQKANPDVEITVMTKRLFQPFFREIDDVRFITPDFGGVHKGVVGIFRLWRDVKTLDITHVADLHDVLRTKMLRRLLKRSGYRVARIDKGRGDKRALTRKHNKYREQLSTSIERYREVMLDLDLKMPSPKMAKRWETQPVPQTMSDIVGEKGGKWVGVAPFAQHRGKIYPMERMDVLIGELSQRYERVFVFGGGEYEKEFAEAMEQRHGERVVSVIGKIGLAAELDLMTNLDTMVTMDSSSMHMASIVGLPVVSVWGATHPYAGFYGFGQVLENAVGAEMSCRPCSVYGNKGCMYGDFRCMKRIEPAEIVEKVARVVGE